MQTASLIFLTKIKMKKTRVNKFPRTFWVANTMELIERWAWYGFYMVFALYLTKSTETGALGFTQAQKGLIMGIGTAFLYALPLITGAIADKIGYKKVLIIAFTIYSSAFLLLGVVTEFVPVFLSYLYLAIGAALFKPVISATIAKTTNEKNSSIGFGIFYMMVNFGAFIGPLFTSKLRAHSWLLVFVMSAVVIAVNFILVLFFYKEPDREKSDEKFIETIKKSFSNVLTTLKDFKFLVFLILIIGFWTMYNQLFYTLPVFIDQWIDTSVLYEKIYQIWPWLAENIGTEQHIIEAEMLTNIDAMYIIIFQIAISALVMKLKPLNAMISGIFIASFGIGLSFATNNPFYILITIFVFAIGEMSSSPKITEYIGRIAPKDKIALYMGASFLPVAGGNFFAGILSGNVYGSMSDKINILRTELLSLNYKFPDFSASFTKSDLFNKGCEIMHKTPVELNNYLWDKYNPSQIWVVFASIGIGTAILLFIFDRVFMKTKK